MFTNHDSSNKYIDWNNDNNTTTTTTNDCVAGLSSTGTGPLFSNIHAQQQQTTNHHHHAVESSTISNIITATSRHYPLESIIMKPAMMMAKDTVDNDGVVQEDTTILNRDDASLLVQNKQASFFTTINKQRHDDDNNSIALRSSSSSTDSIHKQRNDNNNNNYDNDSTTSDIVEIIEVEQTKNIQDDDVIVKTKPQPMMTIQEQQRPLLPHSADDYIHKLNHTLYSQPQQRKEKNNMDNIIIPTSAATPPVTTGNNACSNNNNNNSYASSSSSSSMHLTQNNMIHSEDPPSCISSSSEVTPLSSCIFVSNMAIPDSYTPTWADILPKTCCARYYLWKQREQQSQQFIMNGQVVMPKRKLTLSLINMWEFTITIEPLTTTTTTTTMNQFTSSNLLSSSTTTTTPTTTIDDSSKGLRAQIKRISREHIGRDGRRGAIFERNDNNNNNNIIGGGEKDPLLLDNNSSFHYLTPSSSSSSSSRTRTVMPSSSSHLRDGNNNNNNNNTRPAGKWRIPLGAYYPLLTYLTTNTSCSQKYLVEGIPPEQLRVATLGRERMDKKSYADASDLLARHVSPTVCAALTPYQRDGVEFILDREGCALLADEMGLGKSIMAIAAMSAYRDSDWPLLVLCPSSARYHWEMEFMQWMGVVVKSRIATQERRMGVVEEASSHPTNHHHASSSTGTFASSSNTTSAAITTTTTTMTEEMALEVDDSLLSNCQINVLTSGRDVVLKRDSSTRVVICSIGLIVKLVSTNRIYPGMFQSIIVDESHVLKSKSAKRTIAVLPLLKAARRCLLLSGTPAFARPAELWPQLSVLHARKGGRECLRQNNNNNIHADQNTTTGNNRSLSLGIWCDEEEFMSKYVKGKEEEGKMTRLAELHTLLTSTVMIRRLKADILKNMPPKLREKAYIHIEDESMRYDFLMHMQLLRQGRGILGKLARKQCQEHDNMVTGVEQSQVVQPGGTNNDAPQRKEVLHHLYKISGQAKVPRIAKMLKIFLSDPGNGKLCIFAHHLDVLDNIGMSAGLSNAVGSTARYIRIDGKTTPKMRQEQILKFQTDPSIRVALLGITAAGVAVTLTASSTVWFAELFWTPAIMIQAEDRCHRIGQQARVRCLYFIAKNTLDEILWKLVEEKFREIGEFVDGQENMGIALERELEDGEDEATFFALEDGKKKRKSGDIIFSDLLLDSDDLELNKEIEDLCHEEEDMLHLKNEEEEDEIDLDEKTDAETIVCVPTKKSSSSLDKVIEILDEDEDTDKDMSKTFSQLWELHRESGKLGSLSFGSQVQFDNLRIYTVSYPGPAYGLVMMSCRGRIIIQTHQIPSNNITKVGDILVGVNGILIPYKAPFAKVLLFMKRMMQNPPVSVMYAEDKDFTSFFNEDFIPNLPKIRPLSTVLPRQNTEVIELLDD